jgi:hypothetical protein
MKDKIVPFPSAATANPCVQRITVYRPTTRTETVIAIWLCGWALLTAAECVRQASKTPVPVTQTAQPAPAQTYVAAMYPIDSRAPGPSPSPRETCNLSHTERVLWLN